MQSTNPTVLDMAQYICETFAAKRMNGQKAISVKMTGPLEANIQLDSGEQMVVNGKLAADLRAAFPAQV